jgi:hypothetical protein
MFLPNDIATKHPQIKAAAKEVAAELSPWRLGDFLPRASVG